MASDTQLRQDGSRRPAIDVPPQSWQAMESKMERAGKEPRVQGRPQTGTRTPAHAVAPREEMAQPPDKPPILTGAAYLAQGAGAPASSMEMAPGHDHRVAGEGAQHEAEHHPGGEGPAPGTSWQVPLESDSPTPSGASASRQNLRNLTSDARVALATRLRDYIVSSEDPVGYHRDNGHVHGTPEFLPWHRQFLVRFEQWQRLRLADVAAFVPLAFWDPRDPIPPEFTYQRRATSNPAMRLPTSMATDRLGGLDYAALSAALEAYHNAVHDTVGGDMGDPRISPTDPAFWVLHAYIDNVFAEWEVMRVRALG